MAFQVIPLLTRAGIGLLKASPKIGLTAGITTGIGAGISNVAVHTPGLNEALGQTPEKQAEQRAGNFNRKDGVEDRSLMSKFVDTVTGRDLTDSVSKEDARSYIQKASDEKILKDNRKIRSDLKNAQKQVPNLSGVDLTEKMTAEEYQTAVQQEIQNAKTALNIKERGGEIPGIITAASLAGAQQTTLDSPTVKRKLAKQDLEEANTRQDIIRAEQRLDQSERELRQERRYLREMQATREQNANQFALQMAQQQYQNRSLDIRDAADQRKDKMMIIAQIMKGLENTGRAFTY